MFRRILVFFVLSITIISCPASAQQIAIDLGNDGSVSARAVQLIALITVLSIAPGLAIMITCFPFIVTVLSILRQAIGLQQSPPNMLIISLALFLTYYVMAPVFQSAYDQGITRLIAGEMETTEALQVAFGPFREFMLNRVNPETLQRMLELRELPVSENGSASILIPAFMLSEVERAFQIGFIIFLPFLIIDLVVAAILMSMGMMMVPPSVVSLPFKLAFFVVADGWSLLSTALVSSYF